MRITKLTVLIMVVVLAAGACVPIQAPEVAQPVEAEAEPVTQQEAVAWESRDDVPRIALEDAKAHFDDGTAIFVDSRNEGDFEFSHIAGALNLPYDTVFMPQAELDEAIAEFRNEVPTGQFIITYCT